jgi:two-component system response regulator YesN
MPKIRWTANRGLLQIFCALLLVAVMMFASNYIVYKKSIASIYGQVSENNKLVVQNIIRSFDECFKDINDLIFSVQMLPYDTWKEADAGTVDMHDAYMTQKSIGALMSSMDYIEDVVLFNPKSDLAITSTGTIQLSLLFDQKYRNTTYDLHYWKSVAATKHSLRVFPVQEFGAPAGGKSRKLLVVAGNNQLTDQNMMVFVDAEKLLRQVNQSAMMKGTSLIVMDPDRRIVLNTEENWDLLDLLNDLNVNAGTDETVKRKDYEYHFFKSDYNGFIYVHKAPYQFADLKSVSAANRLIMAVAIACAVMLSAALSFYLYKPVRQIRKLVGAKEQEGADLRNIVTGIVKIQKENESFKTREDVLKTEMRKAAFLFWLDDAAHSRASELRMKQHSALLFDESYFLMAAFHLFPRTGDGAASSLSVEELVEHMEKGLKTALGSATVFHVWGMRFLALCGMRQPSERNEAVKRIRGFARKAQSGIWKGCAATVAVSRVYASETANCRLAYKDVMDCLMYRSIHTGDPVIDIQSIRYTWKVYFPLEEIEKLGNSLMSGREHESVSILDDIMKTNAERHVHHHHFAAVARTIFYRLLRHVELDEQEMRELDSEFNKKMESASQYGDIRDALIRTVRFVAEKIGSAAKGKLNPVSVARYIELHYRENLHLELMAEQHDTTPKYFSNYFKKTFGVNFVDYLNQVRLSHARNWLKTTDKTIAEIGEQAGYLNSSTFTSTFKKYYGISPSEYRKSAGSRQD